MIFCHEALGAKEIMNVNTRFSQFSTEKWCTSDFFHFLQAQYLWLVIPHESYLIQLSQPWFLHDLAHYSIQSNNAQYVFPIVEGPRFWVESHALNFFFGGHLNLHNLHQSSLWQCAFRLSPDCPAKGFRSEYEYEDFLGLKIDPKWIREHHMFWTILNCNKTLHTCHTYVISVNFLYIIHAVHSFLIKTLWLGLCKTFIVALTMFRIAAIHMSEGFSIFDNGFLERNSTVSARSERKLGRFSLLCVRSHWDLLHSWKICMG